MPQVQYMKTWNFNFHAHSLHNHIDKVSMSKIPSRILRLQSDSEDTVCETDMARYESSFLLSLKMEMPGSTKMLVPVCQTPPRHIP